MFSPISSHEILIMHEYDISIFDTRSNTIDKVGSNTFELYCYNNQFGMSRDGQVLALVKDEDEYGTEESVRHKIVSFTKGE